MWPSWLGELFQLAIYSSVRAVLLAAAVGGLLAVMRVPRGGVRHAAWAAVMAAMMLMPVLARVVPPIEVRLPAVARAIDPLAEGFVSDWTPRTGPPADALLGSSVRENPGAPAVAEAPVGPRVQSQIPAMPGPVWPLTVIGAYAVGVLFFLARLAVGWVMMRRLVRRSRPWGQPEANRAEIVICESPLVATPLTVGFVSPVIILPATWPSWPEETLRAVLAHETAHVRRRDPAVAFVAFVNRAIFWFHPLAWWLERAVARNAEDACDGVAIKEVTTPRRYAEVLMEMAEAVRRHKGRVAWQGVGVDGAGMLGRRISRILRGDAFREVSTTRRIGVCVSSAVAIALAVACQQPKPAPAPLRPDPQLTAQWDQQQARGVEFKAALAMTKAHAAELEAVLQKNPEDRETRKQLLTFYFYGDPKHTAVSWEEKIAARRRHVLWIIAHDPGGPLLDGWRTINPVYDPAGYGQAKNLWLAATAKQGVDLPVLSNAAYFFQRIDRSLTERFLLQAEARDPGGPKPRVKDGVSYLPWTAQLGGLYADAVIDARRHAVGSTSVPQDATGADAAFGVVARQKLDETSDAVMLTSAGGRLVQSFARFTRDMDSVDSELEQLGVSYLNRAIRLDPGRTPARTYLVWLASIPRTLKLRAFLKNVPKEKRAEVIRTLPDSDRMFALQADASGHYSDAWSQEYTKHDAAAARPLWTQARRDAEELLALADRLPNDPDRGTAIFAAHVTLGVVALKDNDRASALKHMEAAWNAPPSDELRYGTRFDWSRLAVQMLAWGERESVARFLERVAAVSASQRERLTVDVAQIRAGRMPAFYQSQTVPH